jgi:WD40 repeat protein
MPSKQTSCARGQSIHSIAAMINLGSYRKNVNDLLQRGLARFAKENPEVNTTAVALYCCPWTGVLSLCLTTGDTPETMAQENCPDFAFVEFDSEEFPDWVEEYESDTPQLKTGARTLSVNLEEGDESFNEPFFNFLVSTLKKHIKEYPLSVNVLWAGVQILDSGFVEFWEVNRGTSPKRPAKLCGWKSPLKIGSASPTLFSPDSSRLAAIGTKVVMWNLETGAREFAVTPLRNITRADFSSDGGRLALKDTSGRIAVINIATGEVLKSFSKSAIVEGTEIFFSPCGEYLIDGTWGDGNWNGIFTVRESKTGKIVLQEIYQNTMVSPLFATSDRKLFVWKTSFRERSETQWWARAWPFTEGDRGISLNAPQETDIACISNAGTRAILKTWAGENGKFAAHTLTIVSLPEMKSLGAPSRPFRYVGNVVFSPDDKFLAVCDEDGFKFLDVGKMETRYFIPAKFSHGASFSADGNYFALCESSSRLFRSDDLGNFLVR